MEAVLEAVRRDTVGKNNAGRMRRAGQIPAIIYGGGGQAESVAVDPKQLLRILHSESGENTIITFKLDGNADTRVVVKDFQLHPVRQEVLHVDFYRIAMDQMLRVTVPIHLTGEAKAVKAQGGTVDFVHRELLVESLPANIPEHITIDISNLALHDAVRVRDLDTGGKWTALSDADMMILHVVSPRAAAEATPAEGAAAEPEVIKKGKPEKDAK